MPAVRWIEFGSAAMREARGKRSQEEIAARIPVSSKTYWRWEAKGRVRADSAKRVAEVLGLELPAGPAAGGNAGFQADDDLLHAVTALRRDLWARLNRLERELKSEIKRATASE
jgi:transcriptional regulator with XRE-family HTH domain